MTKLPINSHGNITIKKIISKRDSIVQLIGSRKTVCWFRLLHVELCKISFVVLFCLVSRLASADNTLVIIL